MQASKENARKAREALERIGTDPKLSAKDRALAIEEVATFIDAAERKLPSAAAFKADANRRKVGAK